MTTVAPLVVASGLTKDYPVFGGRILKRRIGTTHAVDGVSFDVRRGETLGLVGESGCGKSTTGRLVMRLIEPDAGSVLFDGVDLTSLDRKALAVQRRRLQLMFQDPSSAFNPRLRVGSIIAEPMRLAGAGRREQAERAAELLPLVGLLPEHAERFPHQFSGGQRQRIGIARALALRPDLVVCDEPVSALDVSVQAQVVNLLQDLQARFGLTYLFISHDLRVVRHIADRVAVMYLGRLIEIAPKAELYRSPQHPYTRMLLDAVPRTVPGKARHRTASADGRPQPGRPPDAGCRFAPRCPSAFATCRVKVPALRDVSPGHLAACHLLADGR